MSNDEHMKCVSPSSRRLATCASTAWASTSTDSHQAVALSTGSTDVVMFKPNNCDCWCLWKSIASSGARPKTQAKRTPGQWPRPHQKAPHALAENVHNAHQRAPASTPAHTKAAVELLRKTSRLQCRVPRQREEAQPCSQLRCAAAGRPRNISHELLHKKTFAVSGIQSFTFLFLY